MAAKLEKEKRLALEDDEGFLVIAVICNRC